MGHEQEALLTELAMLADRARHPALSLMNLADLEDSNAECDQPDDELDESRLSDEQRRVAQLRRGAVIYAANLIVDDLLTDVGDLAVATETTPDRYPDHTSSSALAEAASDSFVWRYLPPRFRRAYTRDFVDSVLITAVKVAHDLARPDGGRAACIAEEFILNAICQVAIDVLEDVGVEAESIDLLGLLLEDLDFENYFDAKMDGIENDPAAQLDRDMWIPDVVDWFTPFNEGRVVHPAVETRSSAPKVHDLNQRMSVGDLDAVRDPAIIDDPRAIAGLDAVSEVVRLARGSAYSTGAGDATAWVPDPAAPESSFADLVGLCGGGSSGRLTWEPHEGADLVRTDDAIEFTPHRHFPVGNDEPWADVAVTGNMMAVPLAAVVSFEPDPEVRRRWEAMFSRLLNPDGD